jgi:HPt (histidine-containing phosphotransfer) domain-containing protein
MKPDFLDSIRARFIERCREDLHKLRELRNMPLAEPVDDTFLRTVHGLAGAGGTIGFPEISRQASDLETLLIDNAGTEADRRRRLDTLIATLERLTGAKT